MEKINLTVIIPVYNEKFTIKEIVDKVLVQKLAKQIIIVDDGSGDGSDKLIKRLPKDKRLELVFHRKNMGKGAAVKTALDKATGNYVIIQDADLEYDPADYEKLVKPIAEGKAEVVYGSRFTGEHRNMFFWHMVANKLLTFLTNLIFDTTLSDMETCYKLVPTQLLKKMNLKSKSFEFEPEVTAKILKNGIRIYEVPISYAGREYSEGKKIGFYDGVWAFLALLRFRFFD